MSIEGAYLRSAVVSIEALEAEREQAAERIKQIYKAAKAKGYMAKPLRRLIRERRAGSEKVERDAARVAGLAKLAGDI